MRTNSKKNTPGVRQSRLDVCNIIESVTAHNINRVNIHRSESIISLMHIHTHIYPLYTNTSSEHGVSTGIYMSCVSSLSICFVVLAEAKISLQGDCQDLSVCALLSKHEKQTSANPTSIAILRQF